MEFRKFNGEKVDLVSYVKNYCNTHEHIFVMVGTDSQRFGWRTKFGTIVALYNEGDGEHGHGAHVIYHKWFGRHYDKEEVFERMEAETTASVEVALALAEAGIKVGCVDIDINPNEGEGSNCYFATAKGWIESLGFKCRGKGIAPLSTSTADRVARK